MMLTNSCNAFRKSSWWASRHPAVLNVTLIDLVVWLKYRPVRSGPGMCSCLFSLIGRYVPEHGYDSVVILGNFSAVVLVDK